MWGDYLVNKWSQKYPSEDWYLRLLKVVQGVENLIFQLLNEALQPDLGQLPLQMVVDINKAFCL